VNEAVESDCVIQAAKMGAKGYTTNRTTHSIDAVTELMGWEKGVVE